MFPKTLLVALLISSTRACIHRDHNVNVEHIDANIQRRSLHTPSTTTKTAIKNVNILSGTQFHPGAVAMVGDKITFDLTGVDKWINGNGGFLIPGLIDSHCHPHTIKDLNTLSSYGVTTAMNMACADYALCASLKHQPGLTSFLTADHGVTAPGTAHAAIFQGPPELLITGPSQAQMFVDYAFGNNSDWLKLIAEPNGMSNETANRLVELAHEKGHQTMTHATRIVDYLQAIGSRTDGIQHSVGDELLTAQMINDIKTYNKFVTPTTVLVQAFLRYPDALALTTYTNTSWPIVVQNAQALYKAKVPILAGTDAIPGEGLITAMVLNPLGKTLHEELEVFVNQVGFKPWEALRAATLLPAQMHRLPDRGIIAEGKRADLVLLTSDPLKNISATRNVSRVWIGGLEFNGTVAAA